MTVLLGSPEARPKPQRLEVAEAVLGAWPVPVSFGGDRACYLPGIDRIQLPDRASFHSAAAFCATWAHEQIHSTGHESRLKRDLGGAFGKARCAREELVTELGAVLLGDRLEISSEIESHAAYLGHWIELLRNSSGSIPRLPRSRPDQWLPTAETICGPEDLAVQESLIM